MNGQGTADHTDPRISVVIPTYDRADLLDCCLSSLSRQTLNQREFEVIVIDDGSTDHTASVCAAWQATLPLRYHRTGHAGRSAAKNLGLFLTAAPIVLFFDDDDVAAPDLLVEHLVGHDAHPEEGTAILGYTGWAEHVPVSHLMHYITEVDGLLYSYHRLRDGAVLDYRYFWCGRTSCKRNFLVRRGLFRPPFDVGLEDIELGRRLADSGLRVLYHGAARQYTARPVTFDGFLARCVGQGRARRMLTTMYPDDPVIRAYCAVGSPPQPWEALGAGLDRRVAAVHRLETRLGPVRDRNHSALTIDELYRLYGWCFRAAFLCGAADVVLAAARPGTGPAQPRPAAAPSPRPAPAPRRRPSDGTARS